MTPQFIYVMTYTIGNTYILTNGAAISQMSI